MFTDVGKGDDLVALSRDLRRREAEECCSEIDVGEPGIFGVETGTQLEQRADATPHVGGSPRRLDDAGDNL